MLNLKNISVVFGANTELERTVLDDLSLTVQTGEFVVIIGGNGSGKSTTFNIISGALNTTKGQIFINNQDVTNQSQADRAALVSKVMQDPRIGTMENLTIFENMAFALRRGQYRSLSFFNTSKRRRLCQDKLALLGMGLEDRLETLVGTLSGGQRQALSLIMALLADSKILLLDEITAALDPKSAETVMSLANTIVQEEKRTCLMITHNMTHALTYGNRTLLLKNGRFDATISAEDRVKMTPCTLAAAFV